MVKDVKVFELNTNDTVKAAGQWRTIVKVESADTLGVHITFSGMEGMPVRYGKGESITRMMRDDEF